MKKYLLLFVIVCAATHAFGQNRVGIGTSSPHSSALLELNSMNSGFLFPRMTYSQRNTIGTPAPGLLIYQTDTGGAPPETPGIYFYDGSGWERIARFDETGSSTSGWTIVSGDQYSNLPGDVGIGTTAPTSRLHVVGNILQENGAFNINHTSGIVQFKNANVNKIYVQLSGNDMRLGTNSGNTAGRVIFRNNQVERMMIDSTGNVGINTMTPDRKLHIYDGSIKIEDPGSNSGVPHMPFVEFEISTEDEKRGGLRFSRDNSVIGMVDYTADADGPNYLKLSAVGAGQRDLMVNDLRRVGINMNMPTNFQPAAQLHVRGEPGVDEIAIHEAAFNGNATVQFYSTLINGGGLGSKKGFIELQDAEHLRLGTNSGNTTGNVVFRLNGTDRMTLQPNGQLAIGPVNENASAYRLTVDGKVICEELKVEWSGDWPDYVFANEYKLMPLDDLKQFIEVNHHLPEIPAASAVAADGFEVGEMNRMLLQKIEELTLYVIQLQEQIDALNHETRE